MIDNAKFAMTGSETGSGDLIDYNQFCGWADVLDPFWAWTDKRKYLIQHGWLDAFLAEHPEYIEVSEFTLRNGKLLA
jgi:hypothetical protein